MDSDSERSFDALFESGFQFDVILRGIGLDDPSVTRLEGSGHNSFLQNISNVGWEEIGRDISNNTHLKEIDFSSGALNDDKASYLFRGLMRSTSIKELELFDNELSIAGVRSMVPFLQHSNNLLRLDLNFNNIKSDGFNLLCRALRDSPIEELQCNSCGIESIEIDLDHFPRHLTYLSINNNNINADGCREIAKLLQGGDSTLTNLLLNSGDIDDEGVAILVDALQNNTTLYCLHLEGNSGISKRGQMMLLKLVNDISSISAMLQSNNTLGYIYLDLYGEVQHYICDATKINKRNVGNPEADGREKVIQTQLHRTTRAALAELQGVSQSVYSEINPLHLPEVLALVGRTHGQGELYIALKSSIAEVISIVDRRQCIKLRLAELATEAEKLRAESEKLHAELVELDAAAGDETYVRNDVLSNKRRRKDIRT